MFVLSKLAWNSLWATLAHVWRFLTLSWEPNLLKLGSQDGSMFCQFPDRLWSNLAVPQIDRIASDLGLKF